MKEQYQELFVFNRSQRRGIYILVAIIVVITSARIILNWSAEDAFNSYTVTPPTLKSATSGDVPTYVIKDNTIALKRKPLRAFDPNTVSKTELMEFGFTHRQAAAFVKYRSVIGGYVTNQQVEKVYGMTPELFDRIVPHMGLQNEEGNKIHLAKEERVFVPIDLNTADSALLTTISGIGPVYARRIVRYRERIGGFAKVEQLGSVYGMKPETINKIREKVIVSGKPLQQNINTLEVKEIKSLPYIQDWNQARAIFNYRQQHGNYASVKDLYKIKLLDTAQVNNLLPYIRFDD